MSTRKIIYPLSISLWLLGAVSAFAGEFSMSSGMFAQAGTEVDTISNLTSERSPRTALGGDSSSMRDMRGAVAGADSDDDAHAGAFGDDETMPGAAQQTTPAASSRTAIPAAVPVVPNRARSSNRWQSLVPGAIK